MTETQKQNEKQNVHLLNKILGTNKVKMSFYIVKALGVLYRIEKQLFV